MKVVNPGDVVLNSFGMGKTRPWVVLWVDDVEGIACVVAITTQAGYPGVCYTGHHRYGVAGAWASIQPLQNVLKSRPTGVTLNKKIRQRIGEHLHRVLAFVED